jgi:hypothetical protein
VIFLTTTHAFPGWQIALALASGTLCLFTVVYWFLFAICIGVTPGAHLAKLAGDGDGMRPEEDERARFR